MTIDERVRDALHAYADPIEPTPGSWDRVEARLDDRLPRERRPRTPLVLAAVGILVIVALIGAAVVRDMDDDTTLVTHGVAAAMPGRIAAVTTDGRVVVLDADSGTVLATRGAPGTSSGEQVAVSADGRAVYFGPRGFARSCADRSLSKLTLDSPVRSVDPVAARASAPATSPDGKYLAYLRCSNGSLVPDEIVLRDLATSRETVTSVPTGSTLSGSLAFAGDSRHVLVGFGTSLHRLDLVGGEPAPGTALTIASWAVPRGRRADQYLMLQDSPPKVVAWRGPPPPTAHELFELPAAARPVSSDASGDHVLAVTVDDSLYRWSAGDESPTKVAGGIVTAAWIPGSRPPEPKPEPAAAVRPPQRVLVFGKTARGGPSMVVLPSASRDGIGEMQGVSNVVAGSRVAVVPDGHVAYVVRKSVSSTCGGGDAIFRQPIASGVRDGEEIQNATAPTVSPDGRYLAYLACTNGRPGTQLVLRDLGSGRVARRDAQGIAWATDSLAFSPDSRQIIVGVGPAPMVPVVTDRFDVVDGSMVRAPSLAHLGLDVRGFWGPNRLVALDTRSTPHSVVSLSADSGQVVQTLFAARSLGGTITDVVPNAAGTAMLVAVDDSRLSWWAPGMAAPSTLDQAMLTAAWMPDMPAAESSNTVTLPVGIAAVRNNEVVVLGATDGNQHSSLGTVESGTMVAPSDDGRTWVLGRPNPPEACDRSGTKTMPALQILDTSTGRRDDWVGGAYNPVANKDDVVAYGYACDGRGLGLSSIRTSENFRVNPLPAGRSSSSIDAVYPLGWSPDGGTLLYVVDVGSRIRLLAARFSPEFFVGGARSKDVDIREIRGPRLNAASLTGSDTVVGVLPSAPAVLIERRIGDHLRAPHRLTELPEPVTSVVADRSGSNFLVITSSGELWRWSRGQSGPTPVADGVTAAVWLPWS